MCRIANTGATCAAIENVNGLGTEGVLQIEEGMERSLAAVAAVAGCCRAAGPHLGHDGAKMKKEIKSDGL